MHSDLNNNSVQCPLIIKITYSEPSQCVMRCPLYTNTADPDISLQQVDPTINLTFSHSVYKVSTFSRPRTCHTTCWPTSAKCEERDRMIRKFYPLLKITWRGIVQYCPCMYGGNTKVTVTKNVYGRVATREGLRVTVV